VLVARHSLATRVTHWTNVLALTILLMSGLQIFNAHPALYWGAKSTFAQPWLSMSKQEIGESRTGSPPWARLKFDTTGLFGWSGKPGMREQRGFPGLGDDPQLPLAHRRAPLALLLRLALRAQRPAYWLIGPGGRPYRQGHAADPRPAGAAPHPPRDRHPREVPVPQGRGGAALQRHQKATYLAVIAILLPLMVLTGLSMSPASTPRSPG
jgi:hypothetical protein